jgi:hypothetical protein
MSIFGIFGKVEIGPLATEMETYNSHDDIVDSAGAMANHITQRDCEEAIAGLAQFETDAEAMKVIDYATIRSWFRQLTISKEARRRLYYLRQTLKGRRQAAIFLDLLRVAANAGWNPDPWALSFSLRGWTTEYVRADRKVFDQWTLLASPDGHRKYEVEAQGDAYNVMRAFVISRSENIVNEVVGLPVRTLMLVSPGNLVAAQWRPKPKKKELRRTHGYRHGIG